MVVDPQNDVFSVHNWDENSLFISQHDVDVGQYALPISQDGLRTYGKISL